MSPTVLREAGYRFFFFSREETKIHVHVYCSDGEAKFWIEPEIELAHNFGLSKKQLKLSAKIIEEHKNEIKTAWQDSFRS